MRLIRTIVSLTIVGGLVFAPTGASSSASDETSGSIIVHQRGPDGVAKGGCYEVWLSPAAGIETLRGPLCDRWDGSLDGAVTITGLEDGRYRLHEFEAPSAHRLTPNDVIATIVDGDVVEVTRDHELAPVLAVEAVNAAGDLVPGSCWIVVNPGETEGGWGRCDKEDGLDDGVTHFIDRWPASYELIHEVTPLDYERVEALTPFEMLDEDTTVTITLAVLPPTNVELPTILLDPARGRTLPSTPGEWTGTNPSFSYQWERCNAQGAACLPIAGATGTEYTVTDADSWSSIRLAVTASNAAGSSMARSAPGRLVQGALPPVLDPTHPPRVIGLPNFGETLELDGGSWSGVLPLTSTAQWQRCDDSGVCTDVPGASSASYAITSADWRSRLRFRLTVTNFDGIATAYSAMTERIEIRMPIPADSTVKPWIEGDTLTGTELVANPGAWTGRLPITFTYRWFRCVDNGACTEVAGVTGDRYRLDTADIGYKIRFQVKALNADGDGSIASTLSARVRRNIPKVDAYQKPYFEGSVYVGAGVQAYPGSWSGNTPMQFGYSWQRCTEGACTDIPGSFTDQYVVTSADVGFRIRFVVTAVNGDGAASVYSPKSAIVKSNVPKLDFNQSPSIVGRSVVGTELHVLPGVWSGAMPMTFEYQWVRTNISAGIWEPIPGATNDRYVLTAADAGFSMKVELWARNLEGEQGIRVNLNTTVRSS